jgi:hypothetical protein
MELNRIYQFLVYANDDDISSEYTNNIKKITEDVLKVNREVSLEVNSEETKCTVLFRNQNVGQNKKN